MPGQVTAWLYSNFGLDSDSNNRPPLHPTLPSLSHCTTCNCSNNIVLTFANVDCSRSTLLKRILKLLGPISLLINYFLLETKISIN